MTSNTVFNEASIEDNHFLLASHMPEGKIWESVFDKDSNLSKLIHGLAIEFYRSGLLTKQISSEIDVNYTIDLISEWEESVGIPDECFSTNVTIEERRKQSLSKLNNFGGVQNSDDFIRVALLFGIDIMVLPGSQVGTFPLEFPLVFFDVTRSATHTLFIQIIGNLSGDSFFPLPFPLPFSSGGQSFLQCIFDKLAPANVKVIIVDESEI